MAVLSQYPEIDVSVHVNGQPATEYPPPDQHGDHALADAGLRMHECYIESQSAQNYTVELAIAPGLQLAATESLCCSLSIDGRGIRAHILNYPRSTKHPRETLRHSFIGPVGFSATSKRAVEEKLNFSPLTTVEEASPATLARDARTVAHLGTISVTISTCKVIGLRSVPIHQKLRDEEGLTIAEKSMKGKELSHGTTFTEGNAVTSIRRHCITRDVKPFAKYIFRYRSRAALEKEMVLSRTQPPEEATVSKEIEAMTEDEVRSLAEQLLRAKREQRIKPENDYTPSLKRTIDLTEDDTVDVSGHGKRKVMKSEDGCDVVDLT